MIREDGSRVVTLRNPGGYILERTRVLPGGRKIALLSQSPQEVYSYDRWDDWTPPETYREETIDYARADREQLRDALVAQPSIGRIAPSRSRRCVTTSGCGRSSRR